MKTESKYTHEQCGWGRPAWSVAWMICEEFEHHVGRWQLNVPRGKFPEARSEKARQSLVQFIEKFKLDRFVQSDLREEAIKLREHFAPKMQAMLLTFHDETPHPEDVHSYRFYELVLFSLHNGVCVLTRKKWNALTKDKCVLDADGEPLGDQLDGWVIREDLDGDAYVEGATPWCLRSCHDSCWRDAVQQFMSFTPHLGDLKSPLCDSWYATIEVKEGDDIWNMANARHDQKDKYRHWNFDEDHNYIGEEEE